MALYEGIPRWIKVTPDHLKKKETCIEAVRIEPRSLACSPDRFKTQEMCNEAVPIYPYLLGYVSGILRRRRCAAS